MNRTISLFQVILLAASGRAQTSTGAQPLKLLVSVEQPSIAAPFPARLTLHLHNFGQVPVWLYRHAQDPDTLRQMVAMPTGDEEEQKASHTTGGSTVVVRLEPATGPLAQTAGAAPTVVAAETKVLTSVGLPHPTLVKLRPGEDYEEKAVIRLSPAQSRADGRDEPLWGHYRLTGTYAATYSNGDEVSPDLDVILWQGELTSNTIELELRPPPASSSASVAGTVKDSQNQPSAGALVSLSDRQEHLVDQQLTDLEGRFAFDHLPLGLYWITVRKPAVNVETTTFRHVELTATAPAGTMDLLLFPPETYEPKQVLHKPVLLRVVNGAGKPAAGATLESTWSSGTVLDSVKGETSDDGTVTLNLIPGRNYVTVRQRGCPKQEQRLDVRPGGGIDDFKLRLDCK
jgi:hypothetical protein